MQLAGVGHARCPAECSLEGIVDLGASGRSMLWPPANKTLPSGSRVAVCCSRPTVILPVLEKAPVAGS